LRLDLSQLTPVPTEGGMNEKHRQQRRKYDVADVECSVAA